MVYVLTLLKLYPSISASECSPADASTGGPTRIKSAWRGSWSGRGEIRRGDLWLSLRRQNIAVNYGYDGNKVSFLKYFFKENKFSY
jgi:hypothetical protein